MAIDVDTGTPAPLEITLLDGDETKGVKAYLTQVGGDDLGEVVLPHVGQGAYIATFTSQVTGFVHATFVVYTDPALDEEDDFYARTSELYQFLPNAHTRYDNRMSTAYNQLTGFQEIIAWPEKNGLVAQGVDCRVEIKDRAGAVVYSGVRQTPNQDGVFLFLDTQFDSVPDSNFYMAITINVDGVDRTSFQSFFTVG